MADGGTPRHVPAFKARLAEEFGEGLCDAAAFTRARAMAREFGADAVRLELTLGGFVDGEGALTTGEEPFNIFAQVASGKLEQPGMEAENAALGEWGSQYVVACNKAESDDQWESSDEEWVGKASMGKHHRFLLTKDLSWCWFNVIVFGMQDVDQLRDAIGRIEAMREAALSLASGQGWSEKVGLFFHCYGHNSVNALHLHVVDLETTGPTYDALSYKNLPLDDVLSVLRDELAEAEAAPPPPKPPPVATPAGPPDAEAAPPPPASPPMARSPMKPPPVPGYAKEAAAVAAAARDAAAQARAAASEARALSPTKEPKSPGK